MDTYTLSTENSLEVRAHQFVAEASELRFPILMKDWPWTLQTSMGNGNPFRLTHAYANRFVYKQIMGCLKLTVYND